jgi:hypothetical protein
VGIGTTHPLAKLNVNGDVTITSTKALTLPRGTTSERPSNSVAGMIRYNTDERCIETYEPLLELWVPISIFVGVLATGGDEDDIVVNGIQYRVHMFITSGQFNVLRGGQVEYLIVAGGGGGGQRHGSGGGAGGLLTGSKAITIQTYNINVGNGGSAGVNPNFGGKGENSSALEITATGGGAGASWQTPKGPNNVMNGGSGGGGGGDFSPNGGISGGTGLSEQGNNGGMGLNMSSSLGSFPAAGGGGAGSGGGNAVNGSESPGVGGNGVSSSITGILVFYSGGGTGGVYNSSFITRTSINGGIGGGGSGSRGVNVAAGNGSMNTGGGGGGGSFMSSDGLPVPPAGAGGSGIVIIRYRIG